MTFPGGSDTLLDSRGISVCVCPTQDPSRHRAILGTAFFALRHQRGAAGQENHLKCPRPGRHSAHCISTAQDCCTGKVAHAQECCGMSGIGEGKRRSLVSHGLDPGSQWPWETQ